MNQTLISKNNDCEVKISLSSSKANIAKCNISVTNYSNNNIYFFNRIYKSSLTHQVSEISKNYCYAYVREDGVLVLAKAIVPVPEDLLVEKEVIPFCSKISPKNKFEEELEIILPIKLFTPYEEPQVIENNNYPVVFRFGYFVGHEKTESMEIKVPSSEGEVIGFDPFDYNYQKIIEVGEFNPIPISKD